MFFDCILVRRLPLGIGMKRRVFLYFEFKCDFALLLEILYFENSVENE